MSNIYDVDVPGIGRVQVSRDTIKEARAWAKTGFGLGPRAVTAQRKYKLCPKCECAPCLCDAAFNNRHED